MQIVFYDNIFLQKYNMTFQANCLILEIIFMKFQSLLFGKNKKKKKKKKKKTKTKKKNNINLSAAEICTKYTKR